MGHFSFTHVTLTKPAFLSGSPRLSPALKCMPKVLTASADFSKNNFKGASEASVPSSQLARPSNSWISIQPPGLKCLWRVSVSTSRIYEALDVIIGDREELWSYSKHMLKTFG